MKLFFIILIALTILIAVLFFTVIKVILTVNSNKEELNLELLWLYPFLKVIVVVHNYIPQLIVYIFNHNIIEKEIKNKRKNMIKPNQIMKLRFKDINIDTSYGFKDPSTTGITCGAINAASNLINLNSLYNKPDFAADNDYININANASLNVGMTLVSLFKSYK
ncbi:MAG: hypothetical protein ACM3KR_07320 [Deltaproteobacteria bacterium]